MLMMKDKNTKQAFDFNDAMLKFVLEKKIRRMSSEELKMAYEILSKNIKNYYDTN